MGHLEGNFCFFVIELNCFRFRFTIYNWQFAVFTADLQHVPISHQMTKAHCLSEFFCFSLHPFVSGFLNPFILCLHFDINKFDLLRIYIVHFWNFSLPLPSFHLISSSLWHEDRATVRSQVMKLLSGAMKKICSTQKSFHRTLYELTSQRSLTSAVKTRSQQPSLQGTALGCLSLQVSLYLYI